MNLWLVALWLGEYNHHGGKIPQLDFMFPRTGLYPNESQLVRFVYKERNPLDLPPVS